MLHLSIISSKEVKGLNLLDWFVYSNCLSISHKTQESKQWLASYLQQELPILQSIIIYLVMCHPLMLCQGTFEASQEKKNPFPLLKLWWPRYASRLKPLMAKRCNLCDV